MKRKGESGIRGRGEGIGGRSRGRDEGRRELDLVCEIDTTGSRSYRPKWRQSRRGREVRAVGLVFQDLGEGGDAQPGGWEDVGATLALEEEGEPEGQRCWVRRLEGGSRTL